MDAPETEEITRAENERRSTFARRCAEGIRTGTPALTDCERRVLEALKSINHELASENPFTRYIRKAA